MALNNDAGQTVGWPTYVAEIAAVYHGLAGAERASAALLTSTYAEAGAIDHFGPALGLPSAYSGHDGFWYWGPPPAGPRPSSRWASTAASFTGLRQRSPGTLLNNHLDVNNADQGAPVWVCRSPAPAGACCGRSSATWAEALLDEDRPSGG